MRFYRLRYSETSSKQIKSLHPGLKPLIKKHIEELKETPLLGKPLERELSGYYSLRTKKFRIIYNVDHKKTYRRIKRNSSSGKAAGEGTIWILFSENKKIPDYL